MAVHPLHEHLAANASKVCPLKTSVGYEDKWLQSQMQKHPVYQKVPPDQHWRVRPLGLYFDGTPFTRRESFVGVFVNDLLSGEKILICVLRKQQLCQCGCRGFCSIGVIQFFLIWCMKALEVGEYPQHRPDFQPWTALDRRRQELAGTSLGVWGALMEIRGDWPEINQQLGFRPWNSLTPCPFCDCTLQNMYSIQLCLS